MASLLRSFHFGSGLVHTSKVAEPSYPPPTFYKLYSAPPLHFVQPPAQTSTRTFSISHKTLSPFLGPLPFRSPQSTFTPPPGNIYLNPGNPHTSHHPKRPAYNLLSVAGPARRLCKSGPVVSMSMQSVSGNPNVYICEQFGPRTE
jgi:hypothetical protein